MINEGNAIAEASVDGKKVDDFDDDLSVLVPVTGIDLPVADVDLLVVGVVLPVADVDLPVTGVDLPVTDVNLTVTGADSPVTGVDLPVTCVDLPVTDVAFDSPLKGVNIDEGNPGEFCADIFG